jgi:hypothetical protein
LREWLVRAQRGWPVAGGAGVGGWARDLRREADILSSLYILLYVEFIYTYLFYM